MRGWVVVAAGVVVARVDAVDLYQSPSCDGLAGHALRVPAGLRGCSDSVTSRSWHLDNVIRARLGQGVAEPLKGCRFGSSLRIFPSADGRARGASLVSRWLSGFRRFRPR